MMKPKKLKAILADASELLATDTYAYSCLAIQFVNRNPYIRSSSTTPSEALAALDWYEAMIRKMAEMPETSYISTGQFRKLGDSYPVGRENRLMWLAWLMALLDDHKHPASSDLLKKS